MNRPENAKDAVKAARKARLAKALKANIKRRKTAPAGSKQGETDGGQR